MRIELQSDLDIGLDLNTAEDMDLANLTFAGSEEGDDLGEFMKERVGNYDYLDIDEDDLQTIPSPDIDASASPDVEEILLEGYQAHARGDGVGSRVALEHHEHLREVRQAHEPDKEIVLVEARKAMMAGIHGDALLYFLASRFDKGHLQVAASDLQTYTVDQHLLGNVILEPELFASCQEMKAFLKDRKFSGTAKLAKSCVSCRGCPSRRKSHCQMFDVTLVKEMPESQKVFSHYVDVLKSSGKLPANVAVLAAKKARNYREATAAIFAWVEKAPSLRREVQGTLPNTARPERREVVQTPREAQIQTVGKLINTGAKVDRIKSSILGYLGKTHFEGVAKEAMSRRGVMPLSSFASCDHPLLMDNKVSFTLDAGPDCGDCVQNYGDHCHVNKRSFTESFVDDSRYADTPDLMGEDETFFQDSTPTMDLTPSISSAPALEAYEVEGLDDGFEI